LPEFIRYTVFFGDAVGYFEPFSPPLAIAFGSLYLLIYFSDRFLVELGVAVLLKPFIVDDLLSIVAKLLANSG
jgi:hypothetical protein